MKNNEITKKKWEEEFDNRFPYVYTDKATDWEKADLSEKVKDFITSLLSQQREELIKEIEKENWHAIEGSSGVCSCGDKKGRCRERLIHIVSGTKCEEDIYGNCYSCLKTMTY